MTTLNRRKELLFWIPDLEIRGLHPLSVGGLPLDEIVLNRTQDRASFNH